jgi:hypothetical protein
VRLRIPITGRVTDFDSGLAELDGIGVSGDPADPVRPIAVDLGDVSWQLVSLDLENEEAEIEVTPAEETIELRPGGNPNNPADYISRKRTDIEKQAVLDQARAKVEGKTHRQLRALTGDKRPVIPPRLLERFKEYKRRKML